VLKSLIENSFDEKKYLTYLQETFEIEINRGTKKLEKRHDYIASYQELGSLEASNEIDEIGFFVVEAKKKNIENIRVGFNQFIQNLIKTGKYSYDGLIVAIYHPESDVWRLSYVALELDENRQLATNPKRYTFELGNTQTKTALERLSHLDKNTSLEQIQEIFSVERLSKSFFDAYKKLYYELVQRVVVIDEDEASKEALKDKQAVASYLKKMLGRIVFLYFVQKKGWLDGNKKFLSELFFSYTQKHPEINFYDEIMERLFFDALNSKRDDDTIELGDHNYKIPYLNGGLFEEDTYDKLDIAIRNEDLRQILELFDSYNFTVIEDTPHDSEVAVDPEMLGRVFEDLLEDRKEKGAFYTPREIVHYMCQESINNYLENKPKELSELEYLKQIKVLDPAIGSGAFPMGMLHEIMEKRVALGDNTPLGELKKEIIQNAIYGVDIEPSAVEIAKLRFWLSIVVDELEPSPLPNLLYKIRVGNSLIENIYDFNPLESQIHGTKGIVNKLPKKIKSFFETHDKTEKKELEKDIEGDIDKIFINGLEKFQKENDLFSSNQKLHDKLVMIAKIVQEYKKYRTSTELFLYKVYFADVMNSGGFDIVIGNPPYIMEDENKEAFDGLHSLECYQGKTDIWHLFTCKGIDLLKDKGTITYIAKNQWLTSASSSNMRKKIYADTELHKIVDFGANMMFENADVQTMILFLEKTKKNTIHTIDYYKFPNIKIEEITQKLLKGDISFIEKKIPKKYDAKENLTFSEYETLLTKVDAKKNFTFDEKKEIIQGIIGGKDDYFIVKKGDINNFTENEKKFLKMLHTNTQKFFTTKSDKYIFYISKKNFENHNIDDYPNIRNQLLPYKDYLENRRECLKGSIQWFHLWWARDENFFKEGDKIIFTSRTKGKTFTYTKEAFYGTRNLFFIKSNRVNLKYMTALLNSQLMYFYMQERLKHTGDLLQIDKNQFMKIPLYLPNGSKPFKILVDKILQEKEQGNDTLALEKEIDRMVYALYGLSDEEIGIIEESI